MDPKELAVAHFEKAILGGFAAWLVFTVVSLFSGGGVGALIADVQAKQTEVAAHMKTTTVEDADPPAWVEDLRDDLDPDDVPEVEPFPSWVMHRRPVFLYRIEAEKVPEPEHYAPVDVQADAEERGRIHVSWEASIENEYVLTRYEVQRRVGRDGEWETLAETGYAETRHEDTEISARTEYFYRVVSLAKLDEKSNVVQRHPQMKLTEDERRRESRVVGPVGTAREVYVFPISVDPVTRQELIDFSRERDVTIAQAREQLKGWADLRIHKWDPETQQFVEKQLFHVNVGDSIGEDNARLSGGRRFDFRTGATLESVSTEKRPSRFGEGQEETVHIIEVAWPNGQVEEITNRDGDDFEKKGE